jgi:hypothetical protein
MSVLTTSTKAKRVDQALATLASEYMVEHRPDLAEKVLNAYRQLDSEESKARLYDILKAADATS